MIGLDGPENTAQSGSIFMLICAAGLDSLDSWDEIRRLNM